MIVTCTFDLHYTRYKKCHRYKRTYIVMQSHTCVTVFVYITIHFTMKIVLTESQIPQRCPASLGLCQDLSSPDLSGLLVRHEAFVCYDIIWYLCSVFRTMQQKVFYAFLYIALLTQWRVSPILLKFWFSLQWLLLNLRRITSLRRVILENIFSYRDAAVTSPSFHDNISLVKVMRAYPKLLSTLPITKWICWNTWISSSSML